VEHNIGKQGTYGTALGQSFPSYLAIHNNYCQRRPPHLQPHQHRQIVDTSRTTRLQARPAPGLSQSESPNQYEKVTVRLLPESFFLSAFACYKYSNPAGFGRFCFLLVFYIHSIFRVSRVSFFGVLYTFNFPCFKDRFSYSKEHSLLGWIVFSSGRMPEASHIYRNANDRATPIPEESHIVSPEICVGRMSRHDSSRSRFPFCILRAINVQTLPGLGGSVFFFFSILIQSSGFQE